MALWVGRDLHDAGATELGILRASSPQLRSRCWRVGGILRLHRTAGPGPARGRARWATCTGEGGCRERVARRLSTQPECLRRRLAAGQVIQPLGMVAGIELPVPRHGLVEAVADHS